MGQRPTRLKGKGVSSTVPKKFSKDGKVKQAAVPEKTDNPITKPEMTFTKGSSMALPDQQDKLNRPLLNADAQEIEQFLQDELKEFLVEDDYENPVYMKIDKEYKVGNAVVYPPTMEQNITFQLREVDPAEAVDGDKPAENDGEHGLEQSVQVTFAYKSLQGKTDNRPASMVPDKPNQDSVAVVRDRKTPYRAIFGVFDGHGPYGEHASHFCRMEMLKMYAIANKQHPNDSSEQLLGHTLRYLDRKFAGTDHRAAKIDPIVSGTTAIVVMLDGNKIIAANVGDSRAILATKQTDGSIVAVPLSDDHKPERPDERARIEASSAILLNENEVRGRAPNPDPSNPGKTYICRHSNGEIVYGVLFTRSIGDVDAHKHLGVSSEPEFISHKVHENVDNGNEQVIVIASDGVWDMMSNEECAQICFNFLDPIAACEDIVKKCSDRWGRSGEGRRDDITVCVVGLGIKFGNNTTRGNRMGSYYGLI